MFRTGLVLITLLIILQSGSSQCLSGNCQSGLSKFRFQNGAIYEGQMAYGNLNGFGTLKYSNGDTYTGGWKMNKREGAGTLATAKGFKYVGLSLIHI